MYDCIIVGSGFCGSVIASELARQKNKKVLVIERRNHIAGNMYDETDEAGILIQKYGPHIFHTNEEAVYEFITKYGQWEPFKLQCRVMIDGKSVPSPFNFEAIDVLYEKSEAEELKQAIKETYPECGKITIVEMLKSSNPVIREYADMLFEKDYRLYTSKQWGIPPEEIDVSVLKRVPVLLNYENRYFDDKYQCMPKGGFTAFFKNLLDHPDITLRLNSDAMEKIKVDTENKAVYFDGEKTDIPVVYTGAIDELLGYRYEKLPYRSLWFDYETKDMDSFQDAPVVAYPQAEGFTRITEYKKLPPQSIEGKTTIATEYPLEYSKDAPKGKEPYYPIINRKNSTAYQRYFKDLEGVKNLFLCGRLADYKYYNMDNAILRALQTLNAIIRYVEE